MRWSLFVLLVWPATSLAGPPGAELTAVDPAEVPESCRDFAKLAESAHRNVALSARIALATCLVDESSKPLVLCDCEQSVVELGAALAPGLAMLDEVFTAGDPAMQILARQAQGELLVRFATRMLATVPPPVNRTSEALALRETRLQMLRPLVSPWLVRAQSLFTDLERIARAHPQLEKNAAVVAAVRSARTQLTQSSTAR
jgi:hypothetical protein